MTVVEHLTQTKLANLTSHLPRPYYETWLGAAYLGDARELIQHVPDDSVDLIITSPPFALQRKKEYGNVPPEQYVDWFMPFAREFWRVTKDSGSLVIHLGGSWTKGQPTRTLYHWQLLLELCNETGGKFHLAQEFWCYNPSRLPTPAEWVTVRRIRVKDAMDYVWWLSKTPYPKADNSKVLRPYSPSMMELFAKGYKAKRRPSGHDISKKFDRSSGGAIPPNVLVLANTESNSRYLRECKRGGISPHPARYPKGIPEFFIKFLTDPGDVICDPFGGSNVTGEAAEELGRHWLCLDSNEEYLIGSKFRFAKTVSGLQARAF